MLWTGLFTKYDSAPYHRDNSRDKESQTIPGMSIHSLGMFHRLSMPGEARYNIGLDSTLVTTTILRIILNHLKVWVPLIRF